MPSREQLAADLHALEEQLPVQGTADTAGFDYPAFQARVAELLRVAAPQDHDFIRERASYMLAAAGLVPADPEGGPGP